MPTTVQKSQHPIALVLQDGSRSAEVSKAPVVGQVLQAGSQQQITFRPAYDRHARRLARNVFFESPELVRIVAHVVALTAYQLDALRPAPVIWFQHGRERKIGGPRIVVAEPHAP